MKIIQVARTIKIINIYRIVMNKKIKFFIPFLALVLIFSFLPACNGDSTLKEKANGEIKDITIKTDEDLTEEGYLAEIRSISNSLNVNFNNYYKITNGFYKGYYSLSNHKEITKEFIREINICYSQYLDLTPVKKFEVAHNMFGDAMKEFNMCGVYLESYIGSNKESEMKNSLNKFFDAASWGAKFLNEAMEKFTNISKGIITVEDIKASDEVASINQSIECNGLRIKVIDYKILDSYESEEGSHHAGEGIKFLMANIIVENVSGIKKVTPNYSQFEILYYSTPIKPKSYQASLEGENFYNSENILPSKTCEGWIIYEIPILARIEDFLIVFKESERDKTYYWSFEIE